MLMEIGFLIYGCYGATNVVRDFMMEYSTDPIERKRRSIFVCGDFYAAWSGITGILHYASIPIELAFIIGINGIMLQIVGLCYARS